MAVLQRGTYMSFVIVAVGVFIAGMGAPAGAFAGSIAGSGATINYTAAPGEANVVTVTQPNAATLVVRDIGVGSLTDGDGVGGCAVVGNRADCPAVGVTR